ncbi:hypothetical protein KG091_08500 [Carnobacteriaceae bacterium zg-ZUI78]|nr:hypothetical protein [Carnobacteriaceae bacterium zg-ZUI78]
MLDISIECKVVDIVECGNYVNFIALITKYLVSNMLMENNVFLGGVFETISYTGR